MDREDNELAIRIYSLSTLGGWARSWNADGSKYYGKEDIDLSWFPIASDTNMMYHHYEESRCSGLKVNLEGVYT